MDGKRNLQKIQKEALSKIIQADSNKFLIVASVRFGKTKLTIDYLKEKKIDDILVVVPKIVLQKQWLDEAKKWDYNGSIIVTTYESAYKYNRAFKAVILDEIHNITYRRYKDLENILNKSEYVIGLTGTLPRKLEKKYLINLMELKQVFEFTLEEAVNNKIVADFNISIIRVPLSRISYIETRFGKVSEERMNTWLNNVCYRNPSKNNLIARANFIYSLMSKAIFTRDLVNEKRFENKKIIVFSKRIEVAKMISENCIYSGNKNNDEILKDFNDDKINIISTVEQLKEGITLHNVDTVIIEQLDSNYGNFIQRIGRALKYDKKDKKVDIIIIVSLSTVDEQWLEKALSKIDKSKIIKNVIYENKPRDYQHSKEGDRKH